MEFEFSLAVADAHTIIGADAEHVRIVRVEQQQRIYLALPRGGRLGEAGVEEVVRRGRDQSERVVAIAAVDELDVIRKLRHRGVVRTDRGPVRTEPETAVRVGKAVEKMGLLERQAAVVAAGSVDGVGIRQTRGV